MFQASSEFVIFKYVVSLVQDREVFHPRAIRPARAADKIDNFVEICRSTLAQRYLQSVAFVVETLPEKQNKHSLEWTYIYNYFYM